MNPCAIDTNVVVRLVTGDDPRQASPAEVFIEKGAGVPVLALAEATWVLATVYDRSASGLAAALEMLVNHKDRALEHSDAVAAALELFRTFARSPGRIDGTQRL